MQGLESIEIDDWGRDQVDGEVLEQLEVWIDPVPRGGPENMAVDEWLLRACRMPILRVYRWLPGWASLGYFARWVEAREALPSRRFVRRWTGGGIVDHLNDQTYSLIIPLHEPLARLRRGESYRLIHQALADALDTAAHLETSSVATPPGGGICFSAAVEHDLVSAGGGKVAGAGQRRTRDGLLHQGSIAVAPNDQWEMRLAHGLARRVIPSGRELEKIRVAELVDQRYAMNSWRTLR